MRRKMKTGFWIALLAIVIGTGTPAPAAAQTVQDVTDAAPTNVMLSPTSPASHNMLMVTFNFAREAAAVATSTDMFRVWYGTAAVTDTNRLGLPYMDVAVPASGNQVTATLTGLMADTAYFVSVARKRTTTVGGAIAISTNTGEPAGDANTMGVKTAAAPMPNRITDVTIDSSADTSLMVSWTMPDPGMMGLTITKYHVQYRTSATTSPAKAAGAWMALTGTLTSPMATISNLKKGTMYDVQVRAENSAKGMGQWSETVSATVGMAGTGTSMPAPTDAPALPLVAALLLGGVLAGRGAYLRRKA